MRDILFRGKRIDNGELIESNSIQLLYGGSKIYLWHQVEWIEVISETIRHYTGLTDKNGNKIFEGDILKIQTTLKRIEEDLNLCIEHKREDVAIVQYAYNTGGYKLKVYHNGKYKRIAKFDFLHICYWYDAVIIGNIHDNSALLEAKR